MPEGEHRKRKAAHSRAYRARHPERAAASKKKYREKNLEAIRERDREAKRGADPEVRRRLDREKTERRRREKEERAGRPRPALCELCGGEGRIVYDHCHDCGVFRGWLCARCNMVLGMVRESPQLLHRLAYYIEVEKEAEKAREQERGEVDA